MVEDGLAETAIVSRGLQEFLNSPDVICVSRLHRVSDAKGLMNSNEVVRGHIELDSRHQVVQLLAERIVPIPGKSHDRREDSATHN